MRAFTVSMGPTACIDLPRALRTDFVGSTYAYITPTVQYHVGRLAAASLAHWCNGFHGVNASTASPHNLTLSWSGLLHQLAHHGVLVGPLGLELSPGASLPRIDPGLTAVQTALGALVFRDRRARSLLGNAEWARLLWATDQKILWRVAPSAPSSKDGAVVPAALRTLLDDGFVRFHDLGLNVTALRMQALDALAREGKRAARGEIVTARTQLRALEPLLANASFARIVRGYLGGSARFDGYATFQLTENATTSSYPSGWWHHDRCGRRLRMFIFIHDVDVDGRPTLAARGSHRTFAYYNYVDNLGLTRFSHAFVSARYDVVPLTGPAGGGFLLDTNALHRAQLSGLRPRTAILLEWHAHAKIPSLAAHPAVMSLPCPSIKNAAYPWTQGKPGYAAFPPDIAPPYRRPRMGAFAHAGVRLRQTRTLSRTAERRHARRASPLAMADGTTVPMGRGRDGKRVAADSGDARNRRRRGRSDGGNRSAITTGDASLDDTRSPQTPPRKTSGQEPQRLPLSQPQQLPHDLDAARACFARRPASAGCAAVYVVAPDAVVGESFRRLAFASMASASAHSLKRVLPFARAVLILGVDDPIPDGQPDLPQPDPRSHGNGSTVSRADEDGKARAASELGGDERAQQLLAPFDEVFIWSDGSLTALARQHPAHLGWLLKPAMFGASPYARSVFFDADTRVEHAGVARLFALLHGSAADFIGAEEVATSNSRRALGGAPIYNSGVLAMLLQQETAAAGGGEPSRSTDAPSVALLRRWQVAMQRVACALRDQYTRRPPDVPAHLGHVAAWALATNDQFGLSQLVTPSAVIDPQLRSLGLRAATLDSTFNQRAEARPRRDGHIDGAAQQSGEVSREVMVRHDGSAKHEALRGATRAAVLGMSQRKPGRLHSTEVAEMRRAHKRALARAAKQCDNDHIL